MSSARRWFVCLALPLTLSWGRAATMEPVAADPVAAEIQRLGHDSYGIREAASRRLWELGRQALPKQAKRKPETNASWLKARRITY